MTTLTMTHSTEFHRDAARSVLPLPSGWWIAPSIIGGGAVWIWAILALIG